MVMVLMTPTMEGCDEVDAYIYDDAFFWLTSNNIKPDIIMYRWRIDSTQHQSSEKEGRLKEPGIM